MLVAATVWANYRPPVPPLAPPFPAEPTPPTPLPTAAGEPAPADPPPTAPALAAPPGPLLESAPVDAPVVEVELLLCAEEFVGEVGDVGEMLCCACVAVDKVSIQATSIAFFMIAPSSLFAAAGRTG